MSAELFPTGRDPLRRLGTMSLIAGLGGLLAIVYAIVTRLRGGDGADEWMLGVGFCLLFGGLEGLLESPPRERDGELAPIPGGVGRILHRVDAGACFGGLRDALPVFQQRFRRRHP